MILRRDPPAALLRNVQKSEGRPPRSGGRPSVNMGWWRCRESNPGPVELIQGFSERSPL
ncbi:hypothetical protein ATKI12_2694 [Kitasatospora sp. Ki12]